MQVKATGSMTHSVVVENMGYQYDSRDGEIFLEDGFKYKVYTVEDNDEIVESVIDLEEA